MAKKFEKIPRPQLRSSVTVLVLVPKTKVVLNQISANQGPNSTFLDKASSTWSSTKPSCSRVIKLIDRTQIFDRYLKTA